MVIARLDEETVASIAEAKRAIAVEHATLLRHAQDAKAAAEVRRSTLRNTFRTKLVGCVLCKSDVCFPRPILGLASLCVMPANRLTVRWTLQCALMRRR